MIGSVRIGLVETVKKSLLILILKINFRQITTKFNQDFPNCSGSARLYGGGLLLFKMLFKMLFNEYI